MTTARFLVRPTNLVDILSVVPYWIERIFGGSQLGQAFTVLRILRLTRIFRVFKLGKSNEVFTLFAKVMTLSGPALQLMFFFILMSITFFGGAMWFAESGRWYPEGHQELIKLNIVDRGAYLTKVEHPRGKLESQFVSIPHAAWFVIVTITTAGYGELSPVTLTGKLVSTCTILCGIVVLAMPVGVIGANFSCEYDRMQDVKKKKRKAREARRMENSLKKQTINSMNKKGAKLPATASDSTSAGEQEEDPKDRKVDRKVGSHLSEDTTEDDSEVECSMLEKPDMYALNGILNQAGVLIHDAETMLSDGAASLVVRDLRALLGDILTSTEENTTYCGDIRGSLDAVCFSTFEHFRMAVCKEPGGSPSLDELPVARRRWFAFAESCWAYWADYPPFRAPSAEAKWAAESFSESTGSDSAVHRQRLDMAGRAQSVPDHPSRPSSRADRVSSAGPGAPARSQGEPDGAGSSVGISTVENSRNGTGTVQELEVEEFEMPALPVESVGPVWPPAPMGSTQGARGAGGGSTAAPEPPSALPGAAGGVG